MDKRYQELLQLKAYTSDVEKQVTLILQNLQWEPKQITEKCATVTCKHDANHRVPLVNREEHEKKCYLTRQGYNKDDLFLPDPVDANANTVLKLSKKDITEIINNASTANPLFKKGVGCHGPEPLTAERLQQTYTADERRAIHDAVVSAAPFCHDLTDLDLLSCNGAGDPKASQQKSRLEILAELRDMKRRRTKYRVAPKTRNYSDVLRDVISSQMESYGEATKTIIKTEYGPNTYVSQNISEMRSENVLPRVIVKREKESPEPQERRRARSREQRYNDDVRNLRQERSSDRGKIYDDRHRHNTERNQSQFRYNNDKRRYITDKYSFKDKSNSRDDKQESQDSTSRDHVKEKYTKKSFDDKRNNRGNYAKDSHKNKNSKHDLVIKQERESPESEYTVYTRDSRDRTHRSRSPSKSKESHYRKHSNNDRGVQQDDRRQIHKNIDGPSQQNETFEYKPYTSNSDNCRKRYRERSRSKERRYDDKKRGHKHKHNA